jgi:UDP-N-acetylglucosamine enolpyruvyl transferase
MRGTLLSLRQGNNPQNTQTSGMSTSLIELLADMGVKVNKIGPESYTFQADQVNLKYLETEDFLTKASSLRGSVMILGPLLARFGHRKIIQTRRR